MFVVPDQAPAPVATAAELAPAHVTSDARGAQVNVESHGYRYAVIGNRLLSVAELTTALQSGDTPAAAIGALKKAYEAKGYFLVALVGQAQDRQVLLQVVQGRLLHVEGPRSLVAFFSGLKGNDTLRNSDVIRQSTLAQAYAATNGQQPQISFKPAPEVGGSSMQISQVPLADSHAVGGSLTAGNFGNRYAGHYVAQAQAYAHHDGFSVQLSHSRALTGMDENTRGAYYAATSGSLSAITPVGTFQLDGSSTRYQLGKAFAPLYPAGKVKVFGGLATQLLYADDVHRWTLQEGLHHVRDSEAVFNGAYALRDQKFNVLDVGSDYSWRFGGFLRQPANVALSGGIKLGSARGDSGFNRAPGSPTGHFQMFTASVGVTQALARGYNVQFNLSGQGTPDTVPSYEQWVLGGLGNLAAYLPGTIVGDRGYLGRLTVQGPQWNAGSLQLRPSVFAEHGAARYRYIAPLAPTWQSLEDLGASLSVDLPWAHSSAMLAYAKPLGSRHVAATLRDSQRAHVFFYVQLGL